MGEEKKGGKGRERTLRAENSKAERTVRAEKTGMQKKMEDHRIQ